MTQIFVRPARPEDASVFLEWQKDNPNFDPNSVTKQDSFTLVAFDEEGPVAFLPVQTAKVDPLVLESVAFRPGANNLLQSFALKELTKATITIGFMRGTEEIYFLADNESTAKFAEKHKFERVPWPVYRLRMADLEGKNE